MNSADITPAQAAIVNKSIRRHLNYLYRLKSRMEKVGFKPDDPLFVKVKAAYDAVFDLSIELHWRYKSCDVTYSDLRTNPWNYSLTVPTDASSIVLTGRNDSPAARRTPPTNKGRRR